ncbi:MAG TPA: hypothetical protein VFD82_13825 [Planctomycetota bacterium]|nr:hypothetical protein [Planctomycetota bacterium]
MNSLRSLVAFLTLLTPCAPCQDPAAKNAKQAFVLEPGEVKMTELIDRCASLLGWNILTSEHEMGAVGGSMTIRLQNRITTDLQGCEDFLTSMLYRSSFALTALDEQKQIYEVIAITGPRQREITNRALSRTPDQVLARPSLKVAVLTVVELKHINATVATNALRPFFASTGGAAGSAQMTLGNVGSNTALLLCGYNDQVAVAIRLLRTCDVAPPPEAAPPSLTERIDSIERRLQAIEQKLSPQQPQQGR